MRCWSMPSNQRKIIDYVSRMGDHANNNSCNCGAFDHASKLMSTIIGVHLYTTDVTYAAEISKWRSAKVA